MTNQEQPEKLTDRKRAAVLAAAVELFSQCCFDRVSMDDIAATAKVSKRTVYRHFNSKDELFIAIVDGLKEQCRKAAEIENTEGKSIDSQLIQFGTRVVDFFCQAEFRKLGRMILARLLQSPELADEMFGGSKLFEKELNTLLKSAVRAGKLPPLKGKQVERRFLSMLESFVVWPQVVAGAPIPSRAERKRIVEDAVVMFLARYGKR